MLATILIAAMVVGACGGSQGATGSTSSTGLGTVKVGTNAEYPPFESVDANGKIIGFDIDLMNAIGKAAGFTPQFTNTKWDGIFVALASGEFDAVSSAVTITEERKQAMAFSDPYFNAGQMIAVKTDSTVTKPKDLAGKKVGVQLGTTGDLWISDQADSGEIRRRSFALRRDYAGLPGVGQRRHRRHRQRRSHVGRTLLRPTLNGVWPWWASLSPTNCTVSPSERSERMS